MATKKETAVADDKKDVPKASLSMTDIPPAPTNNTSPETPSHELEEKGKEVALSPPSPSIKPKQVKKQHGIQEKPAEEWDEWFWR